MTNMSDTGNYFKQPAVAMSFALLTMAANKYIRNNKEGVWQETLKWTTLPVQSSQLYTGSFLNIDATTWSNHLQKAVITNSVEELHDQNTDDDIAATTGFRLDGDDTLMSTEERLQIISKKADYRVSA